MAEHPESMIIPMNPRGDFCGGSTPGSIIAQKWFADSKGSVIVSFDKNCKYANSKEKPLLGFFYDTREKKVTHRFSIVDITDDNGIGRYVEEFLPPWRRELYESRKSGEQRTWVVIKDISRLSEPKELSYFGIERCRSLVYSIVGSELTCSNESQSQDDFIEDIIFRCAISGIKFTEDDLELILWAVIVNKAEYLRRQRSYEDNGKKLRLDMLIRTPKGECVVLEFKRESAGKESLNKQLRPYMDKVKAEFNLVNLKGIIVARDATPDLREELNKENNADISFIPYRFAFISKRIEEVLFQ